MQLWLQGDPEYADEAETCNIVRESEMMSTEVLATFDGSETLVLGPYDQAMVPALWFCSPLHA